MPRTKYSEYSATPGDNTDIDGINIGEGMAPSDVNNSLRAFLSQTREFIDGTSGDTLTSAKIVATTATILSGVDVTGTATFNSAVVLSSSVTGSALSLSGALTVGGAAILSSTLGVTGTASMGVIDATTLEVTNIKAKDGTASATIADSTGVMTVASAVLTTADINGGTVDNTAIGAGTPSTGAFTTLTANSATLNGTTIPASKTLLVSTDIGSTVQAYDAQLADIAGLVPTDSYFIVGNGTNFVAEGPTAAKASIGLGPSNSVQFASATIQATAAILKLSSQSNTSSRIEFGDVADSDVGIIDYDHANNAFKVYTNTALNFSVDSSGNVAAPNGVFSQGGNDVLDSTDIGSTVLAYDSNLQGFVTAFTLPTTDGSANQVLKTDGSGNIGFATITGTGTVTSVDVSGGTTGLTTSGGPVTTSGTITLAGTLAVANGGTGLTSLGTANQVLAVNSGGTALEYQTPSTGISTGKAIAMAIVFG